LLALPAGVVAGAPEINRFGEAYSFTIPAAEHGCAVDVLVEGEFKVVEHLFFDDNGNLVKVIASYTDIWTETGPAGVVRGQAAGSTTTTDIHSENGVETWVDTFRGQPIKFSASGFGVIVVDAGSLSVARTFIANDPDDPEDDEFFQEVIYDRGKHPSFYSAQGWGEDFCAIVAG
jgi:hypothetical protein